ncbi:Complexin-1 [Dermatophagoides pteronyssinus]|uniref:Complexin-1 n=1 Tax=Dermatophagoides pteronyssinus TaxID=6956 RepID=A0ABQ8JN42_DERPT|nr:Complexin-1 [Dermatophagoides pteronyssinus]
MKKIHSNLIIIIIIEEISVGDNLSAEEKERLAQLEQERLEALKEQEERRKEKHRKMEEEREKVRKGIRDKYQIKKRENQSSIDQSDDMKNRQSIDGADPTMINGQDDDDDDEFTKLKNTIEQRINDIRTTIESRCLIM